MRVGDLDAVVRNEAVLARQVAGRDRIDDDMHRIFEQHMTNATRDLLRQCRDRCIQGFRNNNGKVYIHGRKLLERLLTTRKDNSSGIFVQFSNGRNFWHSAILAKSLAGQPNVAHARSVPAGFCTSEWSANDGWRVRRDCVTKSLLGNKLAPPFSQW